MELTLAEDFLAGVPLPAFLVGQDDRIIAFNPLAADLLGPEAKGRNIALKLRAPDLLRAISEVTAGGRGGDITLRLTDDAQYEARVSGQGQGQARVALCVLRDVTRETQTLAMRRDFVANVSHELRTPLTALMGFIETLQTVAREDAGARDRFLTIMADEAGRMNRLVHDLLQLSRVEAEERVRPRGKVDLGGVLSSVLSSLRPLAEARGTQIILGSEVEGLIVPGDSDQLTQVFMNLIENAVKYGAQEGQVRILLTQLKRAQGDMVHIAVSDQGEGIAPVHLQRLTERFYRVDGHRSRAEGGTGLGLAIVKHIINRHKGRLEISSTKGVGSVFAVVLPVA